LPEELLEAGRHDPWSAKECLTNLKHMAAFSD
jgi:hypothetical protein